LFTPSTNPAQAKIPFIHSEKVTVGVNNEHKILGFSRVRVRVRVNVSVTVSLVFMYIICITRMWVNAQPDGRPVERSWRPLFNAAKFG